MKKFCILIYILLLPNILVAQEIKLGVMPPLTGPYADLGEDCRLGTEAAFKALAPDKKVGAREIKLIYGDSQADPKIAINEFKKLIEQDQVLAVISTRSSVCLPLNPISAQKHMPLLCASGHPNFHDGNPYAHQSWPTTEEEGVSLASKVIEDKIKSIAIITGEDEWLLSYSSFFTNSFKEKGGNVILSEQVLSTDTDFSSLLTKVRSKNPDAVFINLTIAQGSVAIKRARELGLKMPIYSNFWSGQDSAIKAAGSASNNIVFTESELDYPEFNNALSNLDNPKKPSGITISCFASMAAALRAIEKDQTIKTSDDMQKTLLLLDKAQALDVSIPIKNRLFAFPLAIKAISDGKVLKLK